jgi:hypothetical protein
MIGNNLGRSAMLYRDLYEGDFDMKDYRKTASSSMAGLPDVKDPEATFAGITRQDYLDYIQNFRDFELNLLSMTEDDSLRQRAVEDQRRQNEIAAEVQQRNIERYGGAGLSNAQRQQQQVTLQRQGELGVANSSNNARVRQREINNALLNELIGIGQGVNQSSLSGLGQASSLAASRAAAYKNAKAQHHSSMAGLGGSIIGAAIMGGIFSDTRLKDNIKLIGKSNGHNIYTWTWNDIAKQLGVDTHEFGVIAQDVMQTNPEAVFEDTTGYLKVNYGVLF